MPGYVVANVDVHNPEAYAGYSSQVDATLEDFQGRFIVRGTDKDVREGEWLDRVVVIEFPSVDQARSWYESEAYQRILPVRQQNSSGRVVIIEGYKPAR
jgi:uncharacterized protein (DUF1330 family)